MKEIKKSPAYILIEFVWYNEKTTSYKKINEVMTLAIKIAIIANMEFYEDDFRNICKNFNGGYWFGVNLNGKGIGEEFYSLAIEYNNKSAIKSFEIFSGLKPFITKDRHRVYTGLCFYDSNYKYRITGFNYKNNKVYIVAYKRIDLREEGKKKLLNFSNKEWLEFRKKIII